VPVQLTLIVTGLLAAAAGLAVAVAYALRAVAGQVNTVPPARAAPSGRSCARTC
jgi:hypothetical protein